MSAHHQSEVGRWRGLERREPAGQVPVRQVDQPRSRPSRFGFSEPHPAENGQANPDDDVLGQDPPGKGDDQREELVQRPKADELRIVEVRWDYVLVG